MIITRYSWANNVFSPRFRVPVHLHVNFSTARLLKLIVDILAEMYQFLNKCEYQGYRIWLSIERVRRS